MLFLICLHTKNWSKRLIKGQWGVKTSAQIKFLAEASIGSDCSIKSAMKGSDIKFAGR